MKFTDKLQDAISGHIFKTITGRRFMVLKDSEIVHFGDFAEMPLGRLTKLTKKNFMSNGKAIKVDWVKKHNHLVDILRQV